MVWLCKLSIELYHSVYKVEDCNTVYCVLSCTILLQPSVVFPYCVNLSMLRLFLGPGLICPITSYHCTLYTVFCTLYTVHCTLYSVHCTLYTVQCTDERLSGHFLFHHTALYQSNGPWTRQRLNNTPTLPRYTTHFLMNRPLGRLSL